MKKSIKINLGGMVLHVDDDAYDLLRMYLDQIQARFNQVPGESEILSDIETRMAELFQERLVPGKEVINLQDAREVVEIMGKPEEIGDSGEEETEPVAPPPFAPVRRRMYRDTSNQRIAGVCSGLAAYFKVDPLFVRILFVVFTLAYGAGVLIYLALWIGVPEAKTAAERLEMYGEPVNVYNIERQVRQDYPGDAAADNNRPYVRSGNRETLIGRFLKGIAKIILVFIKIIGFIIAFSFIIAGIALLGAMIGLAFSGKAWFVNSDWNLGGIGMNEAFGFFVSPTVGAIVVIGLILLVAIPVLGLIYGVLKAIFRFRVNDRVSAVSLSGIWFVTLIVLIVVGINTGVQYSTESRTRDEKELLMPQNRKLIVKALPFPEDITDNMTEFNFHSEFWIARENDSVSLIIRPTVRIEYTEDTVSSLEIRKTARAANSREAREYAEEIRFNYLQQDSVLSIDPVYRLDQHGRFHAQQVEVILSVPAGTVLYLDGSLKDMLRNIRNTEDTWSGDLAGDEWIMTQEGLTRVLKQ